jgi:hypothetical protein
VLPLTLRQAISHFNESWLTSKCLVHSGEKAGLRSTPGPGRPIALSCFDQLPVGVDPPPERSERLINRPAKIGELVEGCTAHSAGIEMPPDEAVALGASQRVGEHLGRDAIQYVTEILEAQTPSSQLSEHDQSPAPAEPDQGIRPSPLDSHLMAGQR